MQAVFNWGQVPAYAFFGIEFFSGLLLLAALLVFRRSGFVLLGAQTVSLILLAFYCLICALPFLNSFRQIKKRSLFDYYRLSVASDDEFCKIMLLQSWLTEQWLRLPIKLPILVVLALEQGFWIVSWLLVLESLSLLLFLYLKGIANSRGKISGWALVLISRIALFAVGYGFFSFVTYLVALMKENIARYGLGLNFIKASDSQLKQIIMQFSPIYKEPDVLFSYKLMWRLLAASIICFVLASLIARFISDKKEAQRYSIWKWLMPSTPKETDSHPLSIKDKYLLFRLGTTMRHHPISLLLTGELALILGSNIALLPHVHSVYIYLFVYYIEAYGLITGVLGGLRERFSPVFRFEDDVRHITLFALSPYVTPYDFFTTKQKLILSLGRIGVLIPAFLLTVQFAAFMQAQAIYLLFAAALLWSFLPFMASFLLKTDFHIFSLLFESRQQVSLESIWDYTGYQIINASDTIILRLYMKAAVLFALCMAAFPPVQEVWWLYFDLIFFGFWAGVMLFSTKIPKLVSGDGQFEY